MKLERGTPSEGSLPEAIVRSAAPPPPFAANTLPVPSGVCYVLRLVFH